MIKFETVRYKNFLSSGNAFTEIYLDRHPMTLVIGENGAGKSTMLDAITFALFGKSYRNINKPQLVNSINGKNTLVEIEFSISNRKYKVVRGLKPQLFEIYCDGNLLNQDAKAKDYQEQLEKNILKFNYKAFTQIVILGRSSFVPFMLLPAGERRVIIEDLLDIQIFSAMNIVVREKIGLIKNEANDLKKNIESTISKIELQKKYVEEAKKDTAEQISRKESEYQETVSKIEKTQNECDLVQKHTDLLIEKVRDENKIKSTLNELNKYEAKIENNVSKLEKNIRFFQDNSTCPTCDQEIQNKQEKILENNQKIGEFKEGLEQLRKEQSAFSEKYDLILQNQRKINDHQSEIKGYQATISQMQKYADKLKEEIDDLKNRRVISEEMMEISKNLVTNLESLDKQRKELSMKKQYIDIAGVLLKDGGIKAKIIRQYLPIINKLVNKYLSSMNFLVNFEINEEFKETIKSRHRDEFSYENFSEGERMRIDLALLMTWRAISKMKNSMSTNLLILDEVFDSSLDSSGTEDFMRLLQTFGVDANVFIISHKGDVLVDKFAHILKFEKRKNFSQLSV